MSSHKQFSYEPEPIPDSDHRERHDRQGDHGDLYAIPLPLYDGSPVNAYVAIGQDGLWLIDGGLGNEHCQSILRAGIEKLGYRFEDIRGLIVTHGHNDHVGAAEAILSCGGQLLAHRVEATHGRALFFDEQWLQRNGMPPDGAERDRWHEFTWPEPTRLLEDGERLRWGNLDLQAIWCPGHTPGLVCLYEPNRKLLFTTDHVMRRAPAPIGVRNTGNENPLLDYLGSVDKLKAFDVETVLPGHGRPFHHLRQRLEHIETDIRHQLQSILQQLDSGPTTAYELLSRSGVRDHRPRVSRYDVSLVLARLRFLEREGALHRIETEQTIKYAIAA